MNFGDWLKRLAKGLSAHRGGKTRAHGAQIIAEECRVTLRAVNSWIDGQRRPGWAGHYDVLSDLAGEVGMEKWSPPPP